MKQEKVGRTVLEDRYGVRYIAGTERFLDCHLAVGDVWITRYTAEAPGGGTVTIKFIGKPRR